MKNRPKPVAQHRNLILNSQNIDLPLFNNIIRRPSTPITNRPDQLRKKLIKHTNLAPNPPPIIPQNTSIPNTINNPNQSHERVDLPGNPINKFLITRMKKIC